MSVVMEECSNCGRQVGWGALCVCVADDAARDKAWLDRAGDFDRTAADGPTTDKLVSLLDLRYPTAEDYRFEMLSMYDDPTPTFTSSGTADPMFPSTASAAPPFAITPAMIEAAAKWCQAHWLDDISAEDFARGVLEAALRS